MFHQALEGQQFRNLTTKEIRVGSHRIDRSIFFVGDERAYSGNDWEVYADPTPRPPVEFGAPHPWVPLCGDYHSPLEVRKWGSYD